MLTKTFGKNRLQKTDVYASVSKPVTAMIVMQLLEAGDFENVLDDIARYDPEDHPFTWRRYVTRDLMSGHSSQLHPTIPPQTLEKS